MLYVAATASVRGTDVRVVASLVDAGTDDRARGAAADHARGQLPAADGWALAATDVRAVPNPLIRAHARKLGMSDD